MAGPLTGRIVLIHPYRPSMAPLLDAFAADWPGAPVMNVLDETLYADVTSEGVAAPDVPGRIDTLLRHAVASGAGAIVFTGSTFGPAVETARRGLSLPVLKADEPMARLAAARGGRALLVCTAPRAIPVIAANVAAAVRESGGALDLDTLAVPEAKAALVAGDEAAHDRLIAKAIAERPAPDSLLLGQVSMGRVAALLPPAHARAAVTSAGATVAYLRDLWGCR